MPVQYYDIKEIYKFPVSFTYTAVWGANFANGDHVSSCCYRKTHISYSHHHHHLQRHWVKLQPCVTWALHTHPAKSVRSPHNYDTIANSSQPPLLLSQYYSITWHNYCPLSVQISDSVSATWLPCLQVHSACLYPWLYNTYWKQKTSLQSALGKGKVFSIHATRAYRGSGDTDPLILITSALDWSEWSILHPGSSSLG
jgi:hypothetical protein